MTSLLNCPNMLWFCSLASPVKGGMGDTSALSLPQKLCLCFWDTVRPVLSYW